MLGAAGTANCNIYLPGHFLEIGQVNYGAFGTNYSSTTNPPPAGYYASGFTGIASVYDYGHDGWTTGTPAEYGDYTLPGSPYEGWGIQVGGATGLNWALIENGGISGPGSLTGGNVSYVNTGGQLIANWAGTASGGNLTINMQTVIDTNASQVVVSVIFRNIGTTTLNNLYYFRGCDPDNDEIYSFNFATDNTVVYQNDADHRVLVTAHGETYTNAFLSLGTKDCRAKCFIEEDWPIDDYVTNLANVYSGTAGFGGTYTAGSSDNGDYGIGLVYNLGNLAPAGTAGDSAVISYAYAYNNTGLVGIDSAFPDPVLVVNGVPAPNATPPLPTVDTFNGCLYSGSNIVPVNINYATTGDWTWSTWTWSPATGLGSTTGVTNTINLDLIPPTITYTIIGTDSASNGFTCNYKVFYLTITSCNTVYSNSPCVGDTLQFTDKSDSLGATYSWTGPGGFTSTLQNPFIYPATLANAGEYYVNKLIAGVDSLDSVNVIIHALPVTTATSNAPLCAGLVDTLKLFATPDSTGETFTWIGPNGFTSTLQNPTIPGFVFADTGSYEVATQSSYGCKDTTNTHVGLVPPPPAPGLADSSPVCQGTPPVPITVTGVTPGATILWYTSGSGGVGSPVTPTVNTAVPGTTTYWATEIVGSCESPRDSVTVQVVTTPPAPVATSPLPYCQFTGPISPITVSSLPGSTTLWYTGPTGGTGSTTEPVVNIDFAGSSTFYISQVDSGCEGPRSPVTIIVNPQPPLPIVTPPIYCDSAIGVPALSATGLGGSTLTWFGPGIPATGSLVPPTPVTTTAGTFNYYVTQSITTLGTTCTSDTAIDPVIILPLPTPPVTADVSYCQFAPSLPLTATGSNLIWYYDGIPVDSIPVPPTSMVGNTTWYVTQSITTSGVTCQSDSTPLKATIIYLPQFVITPSSPYVCQYDSINLEITLPAGQTLTYPGYTWVLPQGATAVDSTDTTGMPSIVVQFDSANQSNYVYLTASDDSGKCSTSDTLLIRVVAEPYAYSYTQPNICVGDTTSLSLGSESSDAANFVWQIVNDNYLSASGQLNIIASSSNSGGPFSISWNDTGMHIIQLNTSTVEGCQSKPTYDTVDVHALPNANFTYWTHNSSLCIEDTLLFIAQASNYAYSYLWGPAYAFNNANGDSTWGRVETALTVITLTVTDPFGCAATSDMTLSPGTCCTVAFPSAFTPNGDGRNDLFRPIFPDSSYHNFHIFSVANRWGQTIFESTNIRSAWDGTYNGVPQDMGVYYYYIKFDCGGNTVEQKGDVTLIR